MDIAFYLSPHGAGDSIAFLNDAQSALPHVPCFIDWRCCREKSGQLIFHMDVLRTYRRVSLAIAGSMSMPRFPADFMNRRDTGYCRLGWFSFIKNPRKEPQNTLHTDSLSRTFPAGNRFYRRLDSGECGPCLDHRAIRILSFRNLLDRNPMSKFSDFHKLK